MSRYAIFVDAGYLCAQALHILTGKKDTPRQELRFTDPRMLVDTLQASALQMLYLTGRRPRVTQFEMTHQNLSSAPLKELLRVYWYDGVGTAFTSEQSAIAEQMDVVFRAGSILNKKQKGVDSRIVQDLFELASARAIDDAVVLTGDGDLGVGIEFAQRHGIRVGILSIEDQRVGVSSGLNRELLYQADRRGVLTSSDIKGLFSVAAAPPEVFGPPIVVRSARGAGPSATVELARRAFGKTAKAEGSDMKDTPAVEEISTEDETALRLAASTVISRCTDLASTRTDGGSIVPSIDRDLLDTARAQLGHPLVVAEKHALRSIYLQLVQEAMK